MTSASWVALSDDYNPWLEVNFMMRTKVQQIFSQGRHHETYWVLSYTVSYSSNGRTFQDYVEYDKIKVKRTVFICQYLLIVIYLLGVYTRCFILLCEYRHLRVVFN